MHAIKIVVAAAAALMVGATGAQSMEEGSVTSAMDGQSWAAGEFMDADSATESSSSYSESQGAQGRSFDASSSHSSDQSTQSSQRSQSTQSSHSMAAGEAYDGHQFGGSADISSGAFGRSFSEQGMSQDEPMGASGSRGSSTDPRGVNHFHGG